MNARYQKYQEPAGKTRKSAAAAKPVRKEGGSATKSGGAGKAPAEKKRILRVDPQTPEFKRLRTIWWASLGTGLALVTVSWVLRTYLRQYSWAAPVSMVTLIGAYAAIFFALYIDWSKMRPMRDAAMKAAKSGKQPKATKAEKHED